MFIDEDYVSFEISKLLDEKQFAGDYSHCYSLIKESGWYGDIKYDVSEGSIYNSKAIYIKESIPAPTLQTAMKWLRKVHNVDIEIQANVGMLGIKVYMPYVSVYTPYKLNDIDIECGLTEEDVKDKVRQKKMSTRIPDKKELIPAHAWFNTYEEACEAAIKFCLTNII